MLVLWILLGLVAGGVLLLAIPLEATFALRFDAGAQRAEARVIWLFGLITVPLRKSERDSRTKARKPAAKKRRGTSGTALAMARQKGMIRRVVRLPGEVLACLHVLDLSLDGRLGLDDPADTGMLWGMVGPLLMALDALPVGRVRIHPDFTGTVVEINGRGHLRLVPIELIWVVLRFACAPVTLRAYWRARRTAS